MKYNEDGFFYAYRDQMFNIMKELKALKIKIDQEMLIQQYDDNIVKLEGERDNFRTEALVLDNLCREQSEKLDELKISKKMLKEEKDYFQSTVLSLLL